MTRSLDTIDEAIRRNKLGLQDAVAAIRADAALSAIGRDKALATQRAAAKAEHEKLLAERAEAEELEHGALYKQAFAVGFSNRAEYRAVYQQAMDADPKRLGELAEQSRRTADSLLGTAVRQAAFDRGIASPLEPTRREAELRDFERAHALRQAPGEDKAQYLTRRLGRSMLLSAPAG